MFASSGNGQANQQSLILMYHRVTDVDVDPWALCVTPEHFSEHLEILRNNFEPLSLQELVSALQGGTVPSRSVVVTFDDGYADNFHNAKPLLDRHDIPATMFVASGNVGQDSEFWWDHLERLLLQPNQLPETLELKVNQRTFCWELGDCASYVEDEYQVHRHWKTSAEAPTSRHSLYRSLWGALQPLPDSARRETLNELATWANLDSESRTSHRSLSFPELAAIAQDELIEIGSHTVTHPVLSALPTTLQRDEILQSKVNLERAVGHPVTSFAYPYGAKCNYSDETVSLVREAGFTSACSTLPRSVHRDDDVFQLPRVQVEDWDGEEFARSLSDWLDLESKTFVL